MRINYRSSKSLDPGYLQESIHVPWSPKAHKWRRKITIRITILAVARSHAHLFNMIIFMDQETHCLYLCAWVHLLGCGEWQGFGGRNTENFTDRCHSEKIHSQINSHRCVLERIFVLIRFCRCWIWRNDQQWKWKIL